MRTALAYAGFVGSTFLLFFPFAVAALVWPTRAWRNRVTMLYATLVARVTLFLAGIRVEATGREHLRTWPAILTAGYQCNKQVNPVHLVHPVRRAAWAVSIHAAAATRGSSWSRPGFGAGLFVTAEVAEKSWGDVLTATWPRQRPGFSVPSVPPR